MQPSVHIECWRNRMRPRAARRLASPRKARCRVDRQRRVTLVELVLIVGIVATNSDFDPYSKGKDGASVAPLRATASRDDIVRANDGAFIRLVAAYDP